MRSIEHHTRELVAHAGDHEKDERTEQPFENVHGDYDPSLWVAEANGRYNASLRDQEFGITQSGESNILKVAIG